MNHYFARLKKDQAMTSTGNKGVVISTQIKQA